MVRFSAALVASWIFCGVAAAQSTDAPARVAIVPGVAVGVDAAKVDALAEEMADALTGELLVQAAGGLEVRRKLPAEGIPQDCVVKPACVADVAKRLKTNQLLFVVVIDSGGTLQVDTTWVDAPSGKSASRPAIDITEMALAKERFVAAAHELLPDAPVRPKPKAGIGGTMSPAVPRHVTTPALITAAVAAVGLGDGIAFGLRTRSRYHACEDNLGGCSQDQRDSIRTQSLLADAGWLVALGGAIATGVLYATSGKEPRLVVTPEHDGGVALTAVGRF
jgi:hypothetical protein